MILEYIVIVIGLLTSYFLNGSNLFELGNAVKPDFMVIFVVFFALRRGPMFGLWIGFFGGLLTDSALGGVIGEGGETFYKIGLHSLVMSVLGYIIGKFARGSFHENYLSVTIYLFLFTLASRVMIYLVYIMFFHKNLNYSFFPTSIYNGIIAPVAFFILTWAYKLEEGDDGK